MKKVGIILGVFFIIVAVVIFMISSKVEDTPKTEDGQPIEQVSTETTTGELFWKALIKLFTLICASV